MSDQVGQRLFHAAIRKYAATEREAGNHRATADRGKGDHGPRPMEYDASGFPIPQRTTDFNERVARLLRAQN
jgi:hypothetical protein